MAKSLQAGKLLIGAIAVSVDPTGTAATTLGIDSALQIKDWLKKTPDLAKLSAELDKAFTTEIAKANYDKPDGIRTLLPQMLEASQPSGKDIAHHSLDAPLIFDTMQSKLTDKEHRLPENLLAFKKAILPLLEQACNDTRLEQALRPALTRAQGTVNRDQSAKLQNILAAVQAGQTGIPLADLQDLAREFGAEITQDTPQVMEFLRSRATDFFAMKDQVDSIPETMIQLSNLKRAAQDAIDRVDLEEVEHLMAIVHATELEEAAKSAEIRANTALLRGKVEDAYRYLSAAADSFGAIDTVEPARKRLEYSFIFHDHGLRYGANSNTFFAQMSRDALDIVTPEDHPIFCASLQNNLGLALQYLGENDMGRNRDVLLEDATLAYQTALGIYTAGDCRSERARTLVNLGNVMNKRAQLRFSIDGFSLFARAIAIYDDVLNLHTRAEHPVDYAITQTNRAIALRSQARLGSFLIRGNWGQKREEMETEAETVLRDAISVLTPHDNPSELATAHHNLGDMLRERAGPLKSAASTAIRHDALEHFNAALDMTDKAKDPLRWAKTRLHISLTLVDSINQENLNTSRDLLLHELETINSLISDFEEAKSPRLLQVTTELRDHIQAKLNALLTYPETAHPKRPLHFANKLIPPHPPKLP